MIMIKTSVLLLTIIGLAGCGAQFGGPVYTSARSPAGAEAQSAEPEPAGSLPPGAEGIGGGPNATRPNFGSLTTRAPL